MNRKADLKTLPTRDNHNCFGCSPVNPSGLHMRFHTDGEALYSWLSVPSHFCGWSNFVHGGVITTILDEVMGWSAIYLLKTLTLTKSITVDFLKPIYINDELRAEGRISRRDNDREVLMEGLLYNSKGKLCSKAFGTFATFPPEVGARFGLDRSVLDGVERLIST
jgi:acyl-coenzyme A thioesterase PaaI-like protein